ncbi:hypothetical protein JCM8097_004212 [Rhodosporidiobolus ruineniae]
MSIPLDSQPPQQPLPPPTPTEHPPVPPPPLPPSQLEAAAAPTLRVTPPKVTARLDSGVALEEALNSALKLEEEEGDQRSEAERALEAAEQAALARGPASRSPLSSGVRSGPAGSANSGSFSRPSPSSGRGSFHSYSSRSPNSRTSSTGNFYEHSSGRSSFERHPSQHSGSHYASPHWSPYGYGSPSGRTPSVTSDLAQPLPAFYPAGGAFYYPGPSPSDGSGESGGQGPLFPSFSQGSPAYVAYQPLTSPPHVSSQPPYGATGFPFSAPTASGAAYYGVFTPQTAVPPAEANTVYDDAGNPLAPQGARQGVATTAVPYYPEGQQPMPGAFGVVYQNPPYPSVPPQQHLPYQPVYFAPPVPPPPQQYPQGPSGPASTASYAAQPPPPPPGPASTASAPYPDYPIRHTATPASSSTAPSQAASEVAPVQPPPPPPFALPYPQPQQQFLPPQGYPYATNPLGAPPPPPPPPQAGFIPGHSRDPSASSSSQLTTSSLSASAGAPPKVYEPPAQAARGQLAQAGLRQAALQQGPASPSIEFRMGGPVGAGGGGGLGQTSPKSPTAGMGGMRRDMPRPPPHSPFALWVGNVPSDASHAELWQFFQTRPVPRQCGVVPLAGDEKLDLDSTGIESIHLITRSNCAFVNYTSSLHLHHAIHVSNGVSLRPSDTRCKPFLCRERKSSDDVKSGVGAQRVGGMHRNYIREQRERMLEAQRALAQQVEMQKRAQAATATATAAPVPPSPISPSPVSPSASPKALLPSPGAPMSPELVAAAEVGRRASAATSIGSGSTTSSFLSKHFERRYFILKSHDEADLRLSVETGLWATQTHNEPVLQQAFRTSKTVYLIFGANGQGQWFGVAKMAGPISPATSSAGSHPSWSSRDGTSSTVSSAGAAGGMGSNSLSAASNIILEDEASQSFPERPPASVLFESERRVGVASPLDISPSSTAAAGPRITRSGSYGVTAHPESAPATLAPGASRPPPVGRIDSAARTAMRIEADLAARETADRLHLPAEVALQAAAAGRKAATLDETLLQGGRGGAATEGVAEGVRRAMLETEAQKRNNRLEGIEDRTEQPARSPTTEPRTFHPGTTLRPAVGAGTASSTWGTPFAVEWITVKNLPFPKTKHIRNSFNGNREVKISRDGTEVEPTAGEALLSVFWEDDPSSRPSDPSSASATATATAGSSTSATVTASGTPQPPKREGREEFARPGQMASGLVSGATEVVEETEKPL